MEVSSERADGKRAELDDYRPAGAVHPTEDLIVIGSYRTTLAGGRHVRVTHGTVVEDLPREVVDALEAMGATVGPKNLQTPEGKLVPTPVGWRPYGGRG